MDPTSRQIIDAFDRRPAREAWDVIMPLFSLPQPVRALSFPTLRAACEMLIQAGYHISTDFAPLDRSIYETHNRATAVRMSTDQGQTVVIMQRLPFIGVVMANSSDARRTAA